MFDSMFDSMFGVHVDSDGRRSSSGRTRQNGKLPALIHRIE